MQSSAVALAQTITSARAVALAQTIARARAVTLAQTITRARAVAVSFALSVLLASIATSLACGSSDDDDADRVVPTLNPDPPITELEAIEIAKQQHEELLGLIEFYGYPQVRVRTGSMLLRELQDLTGANVYSDDSPRLDRQIWAIQLGGEVGIELGVTDPMPYDIERGYGIVGIDAENGDIWLRARYEEEILVNPGE